MMFYPMLAEGDSILWLGSREKGLVRFDKRTEEYQVISLKEKLRKSVDDILSLYRTEDGKNACRNNFWFGLSFILWKEDRSYLYR